ncbi:MAG TPA: cytochrome P450 [Thermoanaerobaculia bacterium]|nr:cytochrome P450 [Thermoanaerobaculia bacterium]
MISSPVTVPANAFHAPVPGPPGLPFLGALPQVRKDPLQFLSRMVREYGDVVCLGGVGSQKFYLVTHPRDIEHVWKTHHGKYVKGANFQLLRPLAGSGLFLNEGESWHTQRRLLQPAFHVPRLMAMARTITAAAEELLAAWQQRLPTGVPFDLEAEMMNLAVRFSVQTLFGTAVAGDAETVDHAVGTAFSILHQRVLSPLPFPWWVPLPGNLRFQRAVASLERVVYRIIAERQASGTLGDDVLSTLLSVRDESGQGMPVKMVRDEVVTMLVAGHESTGITLSWTLYLLSRYPQAARRVEEELANVLGGRTPGFEDLPKLTYLGMVLKESLRLYPPFWLLTRTPIEDDEVNGHLIQAGAILLFSPYVTHRRPDFWPNPEAFDPERFEPEKVAQRPHFAYYPLGGGPRVCIGGRLAEMQATLVLATLLQRYSFHALPGRRVEPAAMLSLRPAGGLWMTLHERE